MTTSLDSLLSQTHKDFEVIIVNDGSVDNTEGVVKRYSAQGLEINYVYQDNAGVAAARNKGLDLATGEYVCFLDADDYYDSMFIEKMYAETK
ncbi:MAG: glycosyltransferase family 2 protein [Spirochaetales bacterium]|nr:glycosyltransferase family 2 protein [Spirochaetales bacterium]